MKIRLNDKNYSIYTLLTVLFKLEYFSIYYRWCPGLEMVKSAPAMQETWVQSLGWEDPPEKEMATHSSNLACKIPWMEELGRYSPWSYKELYMTERLHFHFTIKGSRTMYF